jgi:hypothetical protein
MRRNVGKAGSSESSRWLVAQSPHLLVEDLEGRLVTVGNIASRGDGDEGQKREREASGHGSGF